MSEGTTTVAVGDRDGQVVLQFPKAVSWAALDPETARQVGEAMARTAYKCRYGAEPDKASGSKIAEGVYQKLVKRVELVISSMQRKQKHPTVVASEVVDVVMREVM